MDIPKIQSPSLRIVLSHLLNQIENHHTKTPSQHPVALHWESQSNSLRVFAWPCDPSTGTRVAPKDLEAYRRTHEFKGPCCLCALLDQEDYTESHIGVVESIGRSGGKSGLVLNGEYVAVCARNRCGYFMCLEHFYPLQDIEVRVCERRKSPLSLQHLIRASDVQRYYQQGGLPQVVPEVMLRGPRQELQCLDPEEDRANEGAGFVFDLSQGMTEDQFWSTFVQCLRCKSVFLRGSFAVSHQVTCPRSRDFDLSPYPAQPTARNRNLQGLKAVLGYAPADLPQEYPATPALRWARVREPSPTPTIRCDDSHSDAFDLPEAQFDATPGPFSNDSTRVAGHEADCNDSD